MRPLANPQHDVLTPHQAADFADVLRALADPVRMRLLSMVLNAPDGLTTMQMVKALDFRSQGTVSHHMRILADAGFVVRKKAIHPYLPMPGALDYVASFLAGPR